MTIDKNRNFGLDVMRAIAIACVVLHHWLPYHFLQIHFLTDYIQNFTVLGYFGVEVFFVLSGFLIGNIIIKSYYREPRYNPKVVLNFWMRRWLRTLPLYYIILLFTLFIAILKHQHIFGLWRFPLFLQNFEGYDTRNNDFFGVSWSLSIEEWFYLSFPFFLIFFNFLFKKLLSKQQILLGVVLFYIISQLVLRIAIAEHTSLTWNNFFRKAVFCREDSIAFGVLGAFIFNDYPKLFNDKANLFALIGVILIFIGLWIFIKDVALYYSSESDNVSVFSKSILFSIVGIGVLCMLPYFYLMEIRSHVIKTCITFISKISYSLYLIHPIVFHYLIRFLPIKNALYVVISFLIYILVSLILSNISFNLIEKTFLNYRDKHWKEKRGVKPV